MIFFLKIGQDVKLLWGDEGVKEAFKFRDTHFQLDDGIDYFFDRIDILTQPGFMPSQEEGKVSTFFRHLSFLK